MSDSVKSIFKILIKVPVIIAISYLVFNLFNFTVSYFRLLGVSYSVMQIAMENNYIPDNELTALNNYLDSEHITTELLTNVDVVANDNEKKQYGNVVTVGVRANYIWLTPFMKSVDGLGGEDAAKFSDKGTSGQVTQRGTPIEILYTVPGLKYYPDFEN